VKKRLTDSCTLEKAVEVTAADMVVVSKLVLEGEVATLDAAEEWPPPPNCALAMLKAKFCRSVISCQFGVHADRSWRSAR
jgi:hypothetical protein